MELPEIIILLIIITMLIINSVFSAYEIALTSISLGKLKILAEENKKGAIAALVMKNRIESSLAVVQIGISLAGGIAAATCGAGAEEKISTFIQNQMNFSKSFSEVVSIIIIVIPLTSITIIFGELVPKTIAIKNSEKVCLYFSPSMKYFSYIVYPSVLFFEWATKGIVNLFEKQTRFTLSKGDIGLIELKAQASALKASRIINHEQEKMIVGASNLSTTTVSDILIPEYDIATLFIDSELKDQLTKVHLDPYTRFPVTERELDPQFIIGYVNIKELIFLPVTHPNNQNVREIMQPLLNFEANTPIVEAFSLMMKDHVHLALVKNDNLIIGMITIEDILEEVVGDMQDEFDRLPKHITPIGKNYIVGGGVSINVLLKSLNLIDNTDYPNDMTFSEWVKKNHNNKIKSGDFIKVNNITIIVRKVKLNHIFEAMIALQNV